MTDHTLVARALFNAFENNDQAAASALLADTFWGAQNGGPSMDRAILLGFVASVNAVVPDFRYEDIVCEATAHGFVEEHTVKGTLPDGTSLDLRLCLVATVKDGKVENLREYLDRAGAAGLAKALAR